MRKKGNTEAGKRERESLREGVDEMRPRGSQFQAVSRQKLFQTYQF